MGSYDAVVTHVDGSVARLRPWSAYRADILLPGIGYRVKHRRLMFAAAVRTGISVLKMYGSVAAGAERAALDATGASFLLQAELEACRRLDPTTRACLFVAPRLYEQRLINGATFGFRMEWGS